MEVRTETASVNLQKKAKLRRLLWVFMLIFLLVPVLSGCESTDKTKATMDTGKFENATFSYNEEENRTKVIFSTTINNTTIWNINEFSVRLLLYREDGESREVRCKWDRQIPHGNSTSGNFSFNAEGNITRIEYVSWDAEFDSFWKSWKGWIIGLGIAALVFVASIGIPLLLDGSVDWLVAIFNLAKENDLTGWVYCILIAFFSGGGIFLFKFLGGFWVGALIFLSELLAIPLLCGVIFLLWLLFSNIGSIIEAICDVFAAICNWLYEIHHPEEKTTKKKPKNNRLPSSPEVPELAATSESCEENDEEEDDDFDPTIEWVGDWKNNPDKLRLFTVRQLREYCMGNAISGYSGKTKEELVFLIAEGAPKKAGNAQSRKGDHTKITFDSIAGLEEAKEAFREKVILPILHRDLYETFGKKAGGGILLYGLPGTGKTMFAEAASNETNALFIPVKCSDIKSKWYGESEKKVKEIFDKARKAETALIFFDEFEAIGAKRTEDSDNANNDLVPQILAEMQGVNSRKSKSVIVVIAATNKPWAIDSAFLRPGRFDEKIYIPLPDPEACQKLFEIKLKDVPKEELNYSEMAEMTDGFSGADITGFCEKLKMEGIRKTIAETETHRITMQDVREVAQRVHSSVRKEEIEQLRDFERH